MAFIRPSTNGIKYCPNIRMPNGQREQRRIILLVRRTDEVLRFRGRQGYQDRTQGSHRRRHRFHRPHTRAPRILPHVSAWHTGLGFFITTASIGDLPTSRTWDPQYVRHPSADPM